MGIQRRREKRRDKVGRCEWRGKTQEIRRRHHREIQTLRKREKRNKRNAITNEIRTRRH